MVDLPLPLDPTMASVSPARTENETRSRTGLRSKVKLTSSKSTSPRTRGREMASGASTTSGAVSKICPTRPRETRAVARLV